MGNENKKATGVYRAILLIAAVASLFFATSCPSDTTLTQPGAPLTPEEANWLRNHEIRFAPSPTYPPICSRNTAGQYQGLTMEYIELLKRSTGMNLKIVECQTWNEIMEKARRGEIDLVGNIQRTAERDKFLLFTDPYIEIPNAIIVRNTVREKRTLDNLKGKRVAVVDGYSIQQHIREAGLGISIVGVKDNAEGLQMVSFGTADAMITDLAVASYTIDHLGLTGLRVAGTLETLTWHLSFGVRKDWPMLQQILGKGLAAIPDSEKQEIKHHWISLRQPVPLRRDWRLYAVLLSVALFFVGAAGLWTQTLRRMVARRTAQLATSEKKFRMIFESSVDAIMLHDIEEMKLVDCNPAAMAMFAAASKDELVGLSIPDYSPEFQPDGSPSIGVAMELTEEILANRSHDFEYVHKGLDGREFPTAVRATILEIDGRTVLYGIFRDISEQKRAEAQLKEAQTIFDAFLEHNPIYVFFKDKEIRPIRLSRNYEEMLGMPVEDVLGKSMEELFPSDLAASMVADDKKVLAEGKMVHVKEELGGRRYETTKFPIYIDGKAELLAGFTIDVTERDQALEQIRQAQKLDAIGQLAGGVAHDFNNILGGIMGCVELLLRRLPEDDKRCRKYVKVIRGSAERAADLANKLLLFARQQPTDSAPIDMHEVVNETVSILESTIDKRIEIRCDLKAEDCIIVADASQLSLSSSTSASTHPTRCRMAAF